MNDKKRPRYLQVKVNGKYVGKHRYLYEQYHGEIPEGCCVCFLDGDNRNFDINNLYAIPIRAISTTNRVGCFKRSEDDTAEDFKKKLEKAEAKSKEIDEYIKKKEGSLECSERKRNMLWYKKNRENPEYRAKINEHAKLHYAKKMATDPEYRENYNKYKRLHSAKKRAIDPEYRAKINEHARVYQAERKANDPEYREKERERTRKYYAKKRASDPFFCEKERERVRVRYAKKKALREAKT